MAAGLANTAFARRPDLGPVTIVAPSGKVRWSPLWQGNPAIATNPDPATPRIVCGGGVLPYLDADCPRADGRYVYSTTYRARDHRTTIRLTDVDRQQGLDACATHGQFILVEPYPADRKNQNRQWPRASWESCLMLLRSRLITRARAARVGCAPGTPLTPPIALLQCAHADWTPMAPCVSVSTPTFLRACGVMASATLVLALEGGLQFAAAALGGPAVILWGGCINSEVLGYPEQVNIVDPSPETPCGSVKPCDHCNDAWARLTPELVVDEVIAELDRLAAPRQRTEVVT